MHSDGNNLKSLKRDSDAHDEIIENKTINTVEYKSQISDVDFYNIGVEYKWVAKWQSLTESGIENISIDKYLDILKLTPREKSTKLYRYSKLHNWTIKDKDTKTTFKIDIDIEIQSPNGSYLEGNSELTIKSIFDLVKIKELIQVKNNNENINLTIIDDSKFKIEYNDKSYTFKNESYPKYKKSSSEYLEKIISYSKYDDQWTKVKIGELKHDNDNIYLPVNFEDGTTILFPFDSSETDNELWSLADEFGYSDPIMLEDEELYISLNVFNSVSGIMRNTIWTLNIDKPKKSLIYKIIRYIKLLFNEHI